MNFFKNYGPHMLKWFTIGYVVTGVSLLLYDRFKK